VVFARTWRQTPVGRAIHQMFEIPGYGNYCELAYQLFLLRMEAVDLAEKDKLLAEELAAMRKEYDEKEAEYLRICDYVEKIENNGKLFKIAQRFIEIKNVLEELFLAEKKVKEEIIPQYQQNPTNEELEKQIPETTYMLDLPGVQYPMIKLTALEILAPQFIEFL
jgi:hypothetical protein